MFSTGLTNVGICVLNNYKIKMNKYVNEVVNGPSEGRIMDFELRFNFCVFFRVFTSCGKP